MDNNKSAIVMEMVEAIIDNNYDVNSNQFDQQDSSSMRKTLARVDENNPEDATNLREPVKVQMVKIKKTRRRKVYKKGTTMMMMIETHSTLE